MVDRLSHIFDRVHVRLAGLTSRRLEGGQSWHRQPGSACIHIARGAQLQLLADGKSVWLDPVSITLLSKPLEHTLVASTDLPVEVVSAAVSLGGEAGGCSILMGLPDVVTTSVGANDPVSASASAIFSESQFERCGRRTVLNRLCEVLLIQVLRAEMGQGSIESGTLGGLAHPTLYRALLAIHETPACNWTLDELAALSLMSRTRFAQTFKSVVGEPPGIYMTRWKLGLAARGLLQKKSVGQLADELGYASPSALSRAFQHHFGMPPKQWLMTQGTALEDG